MNEIAYRFCLSYLLAFAHWIPVAKSEVIANFIKFFINISKYKTSKNFMDTYDWKQLRLDTLDKETDELKPNGKYFKWRRVFKFTRVDFTYMSVRYEHEKNIWNATSNTSSWEFHTYLLLHLKFLMCDISVAIVEY